MARPKSNHEKKQLIAFFLLTAVYMLVWVPGFYAYGWLRSKGLRKAGDAHRPPPVFVVVSILIIFFLFLLFPYAYLKNLLRGVPETVAALTQRERLYTLSSMIAKVSLHAVIGFAVIGQSSVLSAVFEESADKNVTLVKSAPDDEDGDTLLYITVTVVGAIVGLCALTYGVLRCTKDKKKALQNLNLVAACVHIISAFSILGVALSEDSKLDRYNSKPDLGRFLRPGEWVRQCFNATTLVLQPAAVSKCDNGLTEVFSNEHRGSGNLNIAVLAFTFAFWSGLCHVACFVLLCWYTDWLDVLKVAETLAKFRWLDYLLSAPLMLLTLNIIFSATNMAGVVVSPITLLGLLGFAAVLEIMSFNVVTGRLLRQIFSTKTSRKVTDVHVFLNPIN